MRQAKRKKGGGCGVLGKALFAGLGSVEKCWGGGWGVRDSHGRKAVIGDGKRFSGGRTH